MNLRGCSKVRRLAVLPRPVAPRHLLGAPRRRSAAQLLRRPSRSPGSTPGCFRVHRKRPWESHWLLRREADSAMLAVVWAAATSPVDSSRRVPSRRSPSHPRNNRRSVVRSSGSRRCRLRPSPSDNRERPLRRLANRPSRSPLSDNLLSPRHSASPRRPLADRPTRRSASNRQVRFSPATSGRSPIVRFPAPRRLRCRMNTRSYSVLETGPRHLRHRPRRRHSTPRPASDRPPVLLPCPAACRAEPSPVNRHKAITRG